MWQANTYLPGLLETQSVHFLLDWGKAQWEYDPLNTLKLANNTEDERCRMCDFIAQTVINGIPVLSWSLILKIESNDGIFHIPSC